MPLLKAENPRLAENMSQMAMELRKDADALEMSGPLPAVSKLVKMPAAMRSRAIAEFLKENGVPEPERQHIRLVEALLFSKKPSACADLPGGITVGRSYDRLTVLQKKQPPQAVLISPGSVLQLPQWGVSVSYTLAEEIVNTKHIFTVKAEGPVWVRSRQAGDCIRLNVGNRTLKKLFIDRKIPAHCREHIPVVADEEGVLGVQGIGANVQRLAKDLPAMQIRFQPL